MDRAYLDARARGSRASRSSRCSSPSIVDDWLAPAGDPRRQPVLPACESDLAGRRFVGRRERASCRPDGRYRESLRAEFSRVGHRAARALAARPRARIRADRRRYFPWRSIARSALFSARPVLGHGNYRGPLKGLYMCGAGTHPGGGVSRHSRAQRRARNSARREEAAALSPARDVKRNAPRRLRGAFRSSEEYEVKPADKPGSVTGIA